MLHWSVVLCEECSWYMYLVKSGMSYFNLANKGYVKVKEPYYMENKRNM